MNQLLRFFLSVLFVLCFVNLVAQVPAAKSKGTGYKAAKRHPSEVAKLRRTYSHKVSKQRKEWSETDTIGYYGYPPKHIFGRRIGGQKFLPGDKFDPDKALQLLFPGNFYSIDDPFPTVRDSGVLGMESWVCIDCQTQKVDTWILEEYEEYPYADGNATWYKDTMSFKDEAGVDNIMVTFSTLDIRDCQTLSGRYTCVFTGLAWFCRQGVGWHLKAFSPMLGCYGSYQSVPAMKVVKLGRGNYGCQFVNSNGGPGGPFFGDLYVFGALNGGFRLIMKLDAVSCGGAYIDWDVHIDSVGNRGDHGFGKMFLTIEGNYNKAAILEGGENVEYVPTELKKLVKTKDSLDFNIMRTYEFKGNQYVLTKSKLKLK